MPREHPALKKINQEKAEREARAAARKAKEYDPEYPQIVTGLAALGYDQKGIADALGVSASTVSKWKKKHPEFAKALAVGQRAIAGKVSNVALDMALGQYKQTESKLYFNKDTGEMEVRSVTNNLPPSERMIMMFLDRMAPKEENAPGGIDGIDINITVVGGNCA